MSGSIGKKAVVIGAGMAGLAAAKALSAHFEHVSILERDALPVTPAHRPGTPQAQHPHGLLAGGLRALDELFPEFEKDLERAGAVRVRMGLARSELPGYDPFPQRDLGWDVMSMSRPLTEYVTRRRVERQDNIALVSSCRVTKLIASPDKTRVAAIHYEDAEGRKETLAADLVADASGRGVPTLTFLDTCGYAKPQETEICIDKAYATAVFEFPKDLAPDWKAVLHSPTAPASSRGAVVMALEQGLWMVTLSGMHGDSPPGDIDGFLQFAKSLRTSTVHDAIKRARRVGEIVRFLLPASVRRHFEQLARFPRGLITIGDAICRFNPVFGQGMSVAGQEAVVLNRLLEARTGSSDPLDGLAQEYFGAIQGILASPWAVAESDFVYPQTRGHRPADLEQRMKYRSALTKLAAEDASVHKLLMQVRHLLQPQSALLDQPIRSRVVEIMAASV